MQRRTKFRGIAAAFVAITVAFVLTACGARVDTVMNVASNGSGTRVMTLTLAASDLLKLTGGPTAADSSIRKNLPSQLTYSGLQPTSDGGEAATFTLAFDSTADYKTKADALLSAGGTGEADIEFAVSDSTLVKGISLSESFSSADLLKWMFNGLVTDGVVASGDSSNMYELGTSTVNFDGTAHDSSGSLDLNDVVNNGFDQVGMTTRIASAGHITRTITYASSPDRYAKNKDILTKFITESTPKGASVKALGGGTWTVTFSGGPKSIAEATSTALGGTKARFAMDKSASSEDPSTNVFGLSDVASCDAVCYAATPISDHLITSDGYSASSPDIDTSTTTPTTITYSPPITSVKASYDVGLDGSVMGTIGFVVPKQSVDAVGNGFRELLSPAKGAGTLKTEASASATTYTVTITGKSSKEFSRAYSAWASGGSFDAAQTNSNWFTSDTGYAINPALSQKIGSHKVSGGVTAELTLPFGSWVANAPTGAATAIGFSGVTVGLKGVNGPLYVTGTGPTVGGAIMLIVIAALLATAVLLLIRRRQAVAARIRNVRSHIDTALAEQRLLAGEGSLSITPTVERGSVLNVPTGVTTPAPRGHLTERAAPYVVPRQATLLNMAVAARTPGPRPTLLGDGTNQNRNSLLA